MIASPSTIFKGLRITFWIIFVGLCIQTGTLLVSFGLSLGTSPENARKLWMAFPNGSDVALTKVMLLNMFDYVQIMGIYISLYASKALVAYLVVQMCQDFSLDQPFTAPISRQLTQISKASLVTGLISLVGTGYTKWVSEQGIFLTIRWATEEILFFSAILYVIAYIFKKGMDLQQENDFTV